MSRSVQPRFLFAVALLAFALASLAGCARSGPQPAGAQALPNPQPNLPFHAEGEATPDDGDAHPDVSPNHSTTGVPFRNPHARVLPTGTLLTVRLRNGLSSASVHPGDSFAAALTSPLALNGSTLIGQDTVLKGRIEEIKVPNVKSGLDSVPGYFRLTLEALDYDGREVAVQTSSLFARSNPPKNPAAHDGSALVVRVQKGRQMTFRLLAPVTLPQENAAAMLHEVAR
ncbi:MAG TPA: hypothetical protein VND65_14350 [Candidatus Binatia bacterium]|nr:hypothetical protein [Candidatus Binatia bacterium]